VSEPGSDRAGGRLPEKPCCRNAGDALRIRHSLQEGRPLWKIISVFFSAHDTVSIFKRHISYIKLPNDSILSCIISAPAPVKFLGVLTLLYEVTDKQHFQCAWAENTLSKSREVMRHVKPHVRLLTLPPHKPPVVWAWLPISGPPTAVSHGHGLRRLLRNTEHLKRCCVHDTFSIMDACKLHRNRITEHSCYFPSRCLE